MSYEENLIKNAMESGLNPDIERAYQEQAAMMKKKYEANIRSLNSYYKGMETYICFAVLCANARAYKAGDTKEIAAGGGKVDMKELIKDVDKLDSLNQAPLIK